MPKSEKRNTPRPKARTPRGLPDLSGSALTRQSAMVDALARLFASYGFTPLDTPALEYADALGRFLPDAERPNEGVFALQDDDEQWLALRYDLTAPLARFVAAHYDRLPKPFRRFQWGPVWRNEKPGPGRFRQFLQIDADTVGAANMAADAEMCMMAADAMEALGVPRGDYRVRLNNRKILDGVLEGVGLTPDTADYDARRLTVLRAMDKYDRLGLDGVCALLGAGRRDESGDTTKGAQLDDKQIARIAALISITGDGRGDVLDALADTLGDNERGQEGIAELREIDTHCAALGYKADRLAIDPTIVRGLGYYTGPVFEIDLDFDTMDENGKPVRFGSVGGGGRYDDLITRFKGSSVPATGLSIGISRLAAAWSAQEETDTAPLVVVLALDPDRRADYAALAQELRAAGIAAECYMGDSGMRAQLRYADVRGARLAVIEGEDERAAGIITIKDLALGASKSAEIADNAEWRASGHAQQQFKKDEVVKRIREILG